VARLGASFVFSGRARFRLFSYFVVDWHLSRSSGLLVLMVHKPLNLYFQLGGLGT
jgi:hypothetical protein